MEAASGFEPENCGFEVLCRSAHPSVLMLNAHRQFVRSMRHCPHECLCVSATHLDAVFGVGLSLNF
jgi:hypothetical protein